MAGSYQRYLEWLALGGGQIEVPLYTAGSQQYFHRYLPLTPAFAASLLATVYRRAYAVEKRGDLALLYYTDDPFVSPKFFRRTGDGWQMDVVAEVANSQETVGFPYTWRLRVSGDDFSTVFADLYTPLAVPKADEYYRVVGGDNRALRVRGDAAPVESELGPRPQGRPAAPSPDAAEYLTVRQAAERIRSRRGTRAVVVLYNLSSETGSDLSRVAAAARACRDTGIDFLPLYADLLPPADLDLAARLLGLVAPFPPVRVHPVAVRYAEHDDGGARHPGGTAMAAADRRRGGPRWWRRVAGTRSHGLGGDRRHVPGPGGRTLSPVNRVWQADRHTLGGGMSFRGTPKPDPAAAARALRDEALAAPARQLATPNGTSIEAVLMEMGYPNAVVTLAVFADGTTSLYFSTGGGVLGAGTHASVRKAATLMLAIADRLRSACLPVTATPYPEPGGVRFYLRTAGVTLGAEAQVQELGDRKHTLSPLFLAGHAVLTAVRLLSASKAP